MSRTIQPHEILISALILLGAFISFGIAGYWAGERRAEPMEKLAAAELEADGFWKGTQAATGEPPYERQDDPIGINAECRGDASDWATIRMANEMGKNYDIPVFVHGTCLTHQVRDVAKKNDTVTIEGGRLSTTPLCITTTSELSYSHPIPCPKDRPDVHNCSEIITNVPQPEGR